MSNTLIILPTYNEKDNLEKIIMEIFRYAPFVDILVVDDDSPDRTVIVAEAIAAKDKRVTLVCRKSKRGRGLAGIDAFKEAVKRKDVLNIIEMDADFSHDPRYIPVFLKEIEHNDIIIGSRFVAGGRDSERNVFRRLLSRAGNIFIRKYLNLDIHDSSSGYRCFRKHVLFSLNLDAFISKGPAIIEEVLYVAKLKKYKIKEIPIAFKPRQRSRTKLGLIKLLGVFIDILLFKNIHLPERRAGINVLRKFAFNLALGLNILGALMFYRHKPYFIWFTGIGSLNLIIGILCPTILSGLKRCMDHLFIYFGKGVSLVSLLAIFYLVFTPIGIILRVLGKDLLARQIDKSCDSYWLRRKQDALCKENMEKMG